MRRRASLIPATANQGSAHRAGAQPGCDAPRSPGASGIIEAMAPHDSTEPLLPSDVPEPAGVAALPHDHRHFPLPVHVGRPPGVAVRISEADIRRLVIITHERRCTICGWKVGKRERCWYVSHGPAIATNRRSRWTMWDPSLEGAGHKECLLYSAIVCPFLAIPGYRRRTDQRVGVDVVVPRGTQRGEWVLAGGVEMRVGFKQDRTVTIFIGSGEPELIPYEKGADLLLLLEGAIAEARREPKVSDMEFADWMTSEDTDLIEVRHVQALIETGVTEGLGLPAAVGRDDPCLCGSGRSWRSCCEPRARAAAQRPSMAQLSARLKQ